MAALELDVEGREELVDQRYQLHRRYRLRQHLAFIGEGLRDDSDNIWSVWWGIQRYDSDNIWCLWWRIKRYDSDTTWYLLWKIKGYDSVEGREELVDQRYQLHRRDRLRQHLVFIDRYDSDIREV